MKKFLVISVASIFIAAGIAVAVVMSVSASLPNLIRIEDYKPLLVSEVYDRNGEKIGEFFRERRIITPHEQIPSALIQAFVSAEDGDFFRHHGINLVAIARASLANLSAGRKVQGGSTITQQLARTLMLTPEKTYIRKVREILLSKKMEDNLSKEDILYLYLNQIYLGQGAYGVGMAAQTYFHKPVQELTLPEMALLAGLPQAPSRYSPIRNPKRAKERQVYVLKRMAEEGYISPEDAKAAAGQTLKVYASQDYQAIVPFYLETVRQLLVQELGEQKVLDEGLKIFTGLDLKKQLAAQQAIDNGLRAVDKRQGYRGSLRKLSTEQEIKEFLHKSKEELRAKKEPFSLILANGENPPPPPLLVAKAIPEYVDLGQVVEGIVTEVDDELGIVKVRFAEGAGLIDIDTMTWARKIDPNVRAEGAPIKKPSQALAVKEVIWARVVSKSFQSERINKLQKAKKVQSLPDLERWAGLQLEQTPLVEAALVSFDQETSDVIALVGGYDFARSEFNRALQSARQTGSSFKALVYAAALDRGYTPATRITDAPVVYEEEVDEGQDEAVSEGGSDNKELAEKSVRKYKPDNHSKHFEGDILFRNALIRSLNVPTVKIVQDVGIPWVVDYSKRLGILSPLNMDITIGLGSSGVTLYELTKVFSVFGRLGQRISPMLIHKVQNSSGQTLLERISLDHRFRNEIAQNEEAYERRRQEYLRAQAAAASAEPVASDATAKPATPQLFFSDPGQLLSPTTAYLITSLLEGVVHENGGTGGAARALGRRVAAKTGSTSGYYDGWFLGYTPQIVTGVWTGFDQEQSMGKGEVGGRTALPIWLQYMQEAHQGLPDQVFPVPPGIVFANIDNRTGELASAKTKEYVRQAFREGTEPKTFSRSEDEESDFYKQDYSQ